jgi:hypothetical protein
MLWSMYLQQIKYFPTPLRSPSLCSIMITFYCQHSLFSPFSATTNSMPVRKIVPTSTTSAHSLFQSRPSNRSRCALDFPLQCMWLSPTLSLVFISLTHDESTRASKPTTTMMLMMMREKAENFCGFICSLIRRQLNMNYSKVNSHLLYCSHLIGQLVNIHHTKHFPRARMDLRMFFHSMCADGRRSGGQGVVWF